MKIFIPVLVMMTLTYYASSQFFLTEILNNNVRLTVNPPYIIEGLSSQVDIECAFKRVNLPSMASVLSMLIGHSNKTNQPVFNYLASVNELEGHAHNVSHDVEVISGSIDNNGESKLHMRFMYPKTHLIGLYMCEVTGFDQIGKPVSIYSTVNVVTSNIKDVVDSVNNMQTCIDSQTGYIETIHKLRSSLCTNYYPTIFYNGHAYYVSQALQYFNRTEMQSRCGLFGGYLIEIDSHDEFEFIRANLRRLGSIFYVIYTGATDEKQEGVWINEHSLSSRPIFDWSPNNPHVDSTWNCQCFYYGLDDLLKDHSCYNYGQTSRYICEIPREMNNTC